MAGQFEVLDLYEIERKLHVSVSNTFDPETASDSSGTWIRIRPPISPDEQKAIIDKHGKDSPIGELVASSSVEGRGVASSYETEDKPSAEHFELAVELTKELVTLRGLKAGRVVANGDLSGSQIVVAQEQTT